MREKNKELQKLSLDETEKLVNWLQELLSIFIDSIQSELPDYPAKKHRKITLVSNDNNRFGHSFGVQRDAKKSQFSSWLFELEKEEKEYLLLFLTVKEALLHFISFSEKNEVFTELFINVITMVWLGNKGFIKTIGDRIVRFNRIRCRIAEIELNYWLITIFQTFFILDTPYSEIIKKIDLFLQTFENKEWSNKELMKYFDEWVDNLYISEEMVAPFYLQNRLIKIIKIMLKLGYEKSSSANIASTLKIHNNTARNYMYEIRKAFRPLWFPIWHLELFNLQNYLLILKTNSEAKQSKILEKLKDNPYIESIYKSMKHEESFIITSQDMRCPTNEAEKINKQFQHWQEQNLITQFYFQPRTEFITYSTFTSKKILFTPKKYEQQTNRLDDSIFKFKNHYLEKSPSDSKGKLPIKLDYNLLNFKSVFRSRGIIKSMYIVYLDEFYEMCKKNNIQRENDKIVTDFLNQQEIRLRRRNLLHYKLITVPLMSPINLLAIEIPYQSNKDYKKLAKLLDQYIIFSWVYEYITRDKILLIIRSNFSAKHPIVKFLEDMLKKEGFEPTFSNIDWYFSKPIPYHELFDFEQNKWKLNQI
jgi:hypothetical protein